MRLKKLSALVVLIISFTVYLLTVCPTVYVGDSGELITAAYTTGIAHPPGYPLFCISGKLFSYLPLSNIAYRVNLLALFFGALTVLMLFHLLKVIIKSALPSLNWFIAAVTLIFAFIPIFWEQSLTAKGGIYTLNAFLLSLMVYIINIGGNTKKVIFLAVICGLGLSNHHTIFIFVLIFFAYVLLISKNRLKTFLIFTSVTVLVSGILYLYLPIASASNPPINWGQPDNLTRFLDHVFRKQYGSSQVSLTFGLYIKKVMEYFKLIYRQFSFLLILVPFGLIYLFNNERKIFYLTVLSAFSYYFVLLYQIEHTISVHYLYTSRVFLIPVFLFVWVWIASGIYFFLKKLMRIKVLPFLTVIFPAAFLIFNYSNNDKSKSFLLYDYGINILKSLPSHSVVFTAGDHSAFILTYLKNTEGIRQDIKLYDDEGVVFENIYGEDFLKISIGEHKKRLNEIQSRLIEPNKTIYFIMGSNVHNMAVSNNSINYKPAGLLYKITNKNVKQQEYRFRNLNSDESDYLTKDLVSQIYFMMGENQYSNGNLKSAEEYYNKAEETGRDVDTIQSNMALVFQRPEFKDRMLSYYKKAVQNNPALADNHSNLGNAYFAAGYLDSALKEYLKAVEIAPKSSEIWNNLGVLYYKKKELNKSAECFIRAMTLNPSDINLFTNLVNVYRELNDFSRSITVSLEGIKLNPNDKNLRFILGNLYLKVNQFDLALKQYEYIIKNIDDKYAEAYNNIGVIYIRKNELLKSVEYFKKALTIKPDYIEADKNLKDVQEFLKGEK